MSERELFRYNSFQSNDKALNIKNVFLPLLPKFRNETSIIGKVSMQRSHNTVFAANPFARSSKNDVLIVANPFVGSLRKLLWGEAGFVAATGYVDEGEGNDFETEFHQVWN